MKGYGFLSLYYNRMSYPFPLVHEKGIILLQFCYSDIEEVSSIQIYLKGSQHAQA